MPPRNQFPTRGSTDGATDAFVITPSDSVDLADYPRAIYVGGAGNITCTMASGDVVFTAVTAGTGLTIRPSRVKATGTTATLMVGML